MSAWQIILGCAAVAIAAAAAFFLARDRAARKRAEDALRAADRMRRVPDADMPSTAKRLRNSRF